MKGKVNKAITAVCLTFVFVMLLRDTGLKASSADISFTSDSSEYHTGDIFTVSIDITADVIPGDFEAYVLYNADCLEFIPAIEIITGGEGVIKISDHVVSSARFSRKYSLKFMALGPGESVISFRDGLELYELEEGYLMSVSCNELKISVDMTEAASSDTSLAVLKVSPGKLSPAFSPDIKDYTVSVPAETEKLTVSAAATDRTASVEVSGNEELKEGNNRIAVEVTAADGSKGKYLIICNKEAALGEEPEATNAPDGRENDKDSGNDPEDVKDTDKGTDASKSDTEKGEKEKEYVVKSEQEGNKVVTEDTESIEALELMESYEKSLSTLTLIIAILSALCMALLIIVIRLALRKGNDELDD